MDEIALIVGAILPFVIALLRRWVTLSRNQIQGLVLLISIAVVVIQELITNGFDWSILAQNALVLYGTSQVLYQLILKNFEIGDRLEGTK